MKPDIADNSSFLGKLTTTGRITGRERTITLRLVRYKGKFYASRRARNGDWLSNITSNPSVVVEANGKEIRGYAKEINDKSLCKIISRLKYSDERRDENRVVVEISPEI